MFLKLLEKYRNQKKISQILDTIANYEDWKNERHYLIVDSQECLEFIDSLPQDNDIRFSKKWLEEIVDTLSHPQKLTVPRSKKSEPTKNPRAALSYPG